MRRPKRGDSDNFGGLAGWLFADIALVLALAFLSSKVIGKAAADAAQSITTTTTTTTTTTLPQGTTQPADAVNVKEIELSGVCIRNPRLFDEAVARIEQKLATQNVPSSTRFGVMLIYAGYDSSVSDANLKNAQNEARQRAKDLRDTLQGWKRLNSERWIKDLGHDSGTSEGCYRVYLLRQLNNR